MISARAWCSPSTSTRSPPSAPSTRATANWRTWSGSAGWRRIRRIVLPAALPGFLVGLRMAMAVAWLLLVFAEQINATSGLGLSDHPGADVLPVQRDRRVPRLLRRLGPAHRRARPRPRARPSAAGSRADDCHLTPTVAASRCRHFPATRRGGARPAPHVRRPRGAPRHRLRHRGRRVRRAARPERLGQEHDPPGAGRARPGVRSATCACPQRRPVVYQEPRLLPWARVLANVVLGLDRRGRRGRRSERRSTRSV